MSLNSQELTTNFFTTELKELNDVGSLDDAWEVQADLKARVKYLTENGLIDHEAIAEIARDNAEQYGLDSELADHTFDVEQKATPRSKQHPVWEGTGTSLASVGTDIVHYLNKPGTVEAMYPGGLFYVVDKLTWLVLANAETPYIRLDNTGGYQYVTEKLNAHGRSGKPHIGSTIVRLGDIREPGDERAGPQRIIASTSGTLMNGWADGLYQATPAYAKRAEDDIEAFDGHIENRRAGLYDVVFATMQAKALYGQDQNGRTFEVADPNRYTDVDIN